MNFEVDNDQNLITSLEDNSTYVVKVPYTLTENITVTYIDDTTGKILETQKLSGEPNTNSQYSTKDTINKYLGDHYFLVSDPTNQQMLMFDNDEDPDDQNYEIHFSHSFKDLSNIKTIRETIVYVYDNGSEAAPTYTDSMHFTQTGKLDLVTNVENWRNWTPDSNIFKLVQSPIIAGYTADHKQIDQQTITHNSPDLLFKVIYTAQPVEPTKPVEPNKPIQPTKPIEPTKPVQPDKPVQPTKPVQPDKPVEPTKPVQPDKPVQPTKPVVPDKPVQPTEPVEPDKPVQPTEPVKPTKPIQSAKLVEPTSKIKETPQSTVVVPTKENRKNVLPQTGVKKDNTGILGLTLSTASFLLGLLGSDLKRKKKN